MASIHSAQRSVAEHAQVLAREINDLVSTLVSSWPWPQAYLCECDDARCSRLVMLTPVQYARLRACRQFAVSGDHPLTPDHEVVQELEGVLVVRPRGPWRKAACTL